MGGFLLMELDSEASALRLWHSSLQFSSARLIFVVVPGMLCLFGHLRATHTHITAVALMFHKFLQKPFCLGVGGFVKAPDGISRESRI